MLPEFLSTILIASTLQAKTQLMANKGVKTVITGNVGPNAFKALSTAGIEIITGAVGTVREVVEKFNRGEFSRTKAPTVNDHFGSSQGQ